MAVLAEWLFATGYTEEEVLGKQPSILQSGRQNKLFYAEMWHSPDHSGQWKSEIWNRRKDGEIYPEWLSVNAVRNDRGEVSHYVGVFTDITEIKRSQEKVSFLAYHDPLTQLPNRLLFHDRLAQAIQRAVREKSVFAVVFIDLDHFKNVNDSLGHHVLDRLLQEVASQMQSQLRNSGLPVRVPGTGRGVSFFQGGNEHVTNCYRVHFGNAEGASAGKKIPTRFDHPASLTCCLDNKQNGLQPLFCNTRKHLRTIAVPQFCRIIPSDFLRSPTFVFIRPLISGKRTPGHNASH